MKTPEQLTQHRPEYAGLITDIYNSLGEYIPEVVEYGITAGYPGFTYLADTHPFAIKHQEKILYLVSEIAEMSGADPDDIVKEMPQLKDPDPETLKDIYIYLGGNEPDPGNVTNNMAWFAAEQICNWFVE